PTCQGARGGRLPGPRRRGQTTQGPHHPEGSRAPGGARLRRECRRIGRPGIRVGAECERTRYAPGRTRSDMTTARIRTRPANGGLTWENSAYTHLISHSGSLVPLGARGVSPLALVIDQRSTHSSTHSSSHSAGGSE